MLALPGNPRILVYQEPIHMNKGFEGLSALVQESYTETLTSGAFFVFINRRRDRMKVLYWDSDGLAIWFKRLEVGRFSLNKERQVTFSRRDFLMLLEGVVPARRNKRYLLKEKN